MGVVLLRSWGCEVSRRGRVCTVVEVDGEEMRVQWAGQPSEEDVDAFKELVRAAKRRLEQQGEETR